MRAVLKASWFVGLMISSGWNAVAGPVDDAMNADRAFARMAQTHGVAVAFGAYAAKDGIRFTPGNPERGPEVIKASVARDFADGGKLNWEPKEGTASNDGSLVVVWGRWTFVPQKGDASRQGTYLTVWQKQADGSWKFTHDIGNSDPKPAN